MERNEVQADIEDEDNFIEFNAGADTSPKPSTVPGITIPEIVTPEPIAGIDGDPDAGDLDVFLISSIGWLLMKSSNLSASNWRRVGAPCVVNMY